MRDKMFLVNFVIEVKNFAKKEKNITYIRFSVMLFFTFAHLLILVVQNR